MTELLPCPFCGGEPEVKQRKVHHTDWFGKDYRVMYRVRCKKCGASIGRYSPTMFYKYERTGEEWGAGVQWNTRTERTCRVVSSRFEDLVDEWCFELSCGHAIWFSDSEPPRYCHECGAKVVGE